jgi:hypothetical protein
MVRGKQSAAMGEALGWAARIIGMGVVMFLPAVSGSWLDARLGTGFLGPVGLAVGFAAGVAWLVRLAPGRRRS